MARDDDRYEYYWSYFPRPSPPREAKGGIKSRSKRGSFGESWWARRWISVLDGFGIEKRLRRGRSYARRGQVLSIDLEKGKITARVQGSRAQPYDVVIKLKQLARDEWDRVTAAMSREAYFGAKLLAGELPSEVEGVFEQEGVSLFPKRLSDLETDCSCPDWSNPCKHIAAVYYLLAEEFDRDPFLIMKLRGRTRQQLVELFELAVEAESQSPLTGLESAAPMVDSTVDAELLSADPTQFWSGRRLPDNLFGEVQRPPMTAPLLKRLGGFPFWQGSESFQDAFERIYNAASEKGLTVFIGEWER